GLAPKCRVTDKPEWGADAIFTVAHDTMKFQSYYKLPAPQTSNENCVAHNGSLIPVPGRDIMVQGWYQGGVSVFDWTDPAHPKEIAYFDRGPMDSTKLVGAGSWSAYWYNGYIVSSEIGRGLDGRDLGPSRAVAGEPPGLDRAVMKTTFLAIITAGACATTTHQAPAEHIVSPAAQVHPDSGRPPYTSADVHFMTGMIGHHAQAVLIAGWAPSHAASAAVRALCERIVVGQRDE